MNAQALKQEVSALWKVYGGGSLDILDLAISVFFPAPGEDDLGEWEGEDAIVGRQALALCDFNCYFIPWLSVLSGALVDQCGMNPRLTTAEQMDKRGERFYCVPCAIEAGYDELDLCTWRAALRHAYEVHDQDGNDGLTFDSVSSFPTTDKAVRRELRRRIKEEREEGSWENEVWCCTYCFNIDPFREQQSPRSHPSMILHLTNEHEIYFHRMHIDYFVLESRRRLVEEPVKVFGVNSAYFV